MTAGRCSLLHGCEKKDRKEIGCTNSLKEHTIKRRKKIEMILDMYDGAVTHKHSE